MHARAWLAAVAAGGAIGIGLSAHAAYRAISEHPVGSTVTSIAAAGYERQDHFPGAALFYVAQDAAAPATGATGTTDLPALPISATLVGGDDGVVAARPFSMAGTSTTDRNRALLCLTTALYYEAASEPDAAS
jgi:spore germination cell wall hydrolase CwlJ-like protein